jgi:pimeloyl-ACP methyl ester carboxylesterase
MELRRPDGAVLHWNAVGIGPDVVLSHGLIGDHRTFDAVTDDLAARGYRVVRWDARDHGRSTRGPARFDDLVDDLVAVIAASEARAPVLVGHDLGGVLSLAAALRDPSAYTALSLWAVDGAPSMLANRVNAALFAAARQVSIRPVTMALEPFWIRRRAEGHDVVGAALHRRVASAASAGAIAPLVEALAARPDLRPRIGDLPLPVQVLWGASDLLVRAGAGRELLAAIPHAEGGPVAEAAHLLHVDRPYVVLDLLGAFVGRVTSRA